MGEVGDLVGVLHEYVYLCIVVASSWSSDD